MGCIRVQQFEAERIDSMSFFKSFTKTCVVAMAAFSLLGQVSAPAFAQDDDVPGVKKPLRELKKDIVLNADDANHKVVYVIDMMGTFGRDITITPMRQVVEDVKKVQPDYLVLHVNMDYTTKTGERTADYDPRGAGYAFNQGLELARELMTLLTDEIQNDSKLTKKPKLLAWVGKALGGSAFVPMFCETIYFSPDGLLGGIGGLENLARGVGDEVAQEKQRGLRLGRAEGLALKGKHDPVLVRAMARTEVELSYAFENGKVVFFEDYSKGEFKLTDNGSEEDNNADSIDDIVRMRGNDVLTLNAETAKRIQFSQGTVNNVDDLLFELGVDRSYTLTRGKGDDILRNWAKGVGDAEKRLRELFRTLREVQVEGETPAQRNQGRGRQLGILGDIEKVLLTEQVSKHPFRFLKLRSRQ
jgi:hypothetical protein